MRNSSIKNILLFVSSLWLACCPSARATNDVADQYIRAEVYYYGWDVLTRSKLSLDMVRQSPQIKIIIYDSFEVSRFISWLRLDDMRGRNEPSTTDQSEDPRLVIDLFKADRQHVTYYASRFNLFSEDSRKRRPIDDAFRQKFLF
jgi:hypothetical protein